MKKILVVLMALFVAMPVTAGAMPITFGETSGQVSDFYKISDGVFFTVGASGNLPVATTDDWSFVGGSSTQTVLQAVVGTEVSQTGDFWINFVNPAQNVSFDSGLWNGVGLGEVTVYFHDGTDSGPILNDILGIIPFSFSGLVDRIYFNNANNGVVPPAGITNLSFEIAAAPIPEPGTLLLLGSGLLGLIPYGRKRRKR